MKIKLIFDDWRKEGRSVYSVEECLKLSSGDFHSGTTFIGKIHLDKSQEEELKMAIEDGYNPVFWITI